MMSSRRLHALLLGFAVAGAMTLPTQAQVLVGSNGTSASLAPITLNKSTAKAVRTLSNTKLKTNYVASPNAYFVLHMADIPSATTQATVAKYATLVHYIPDGFYLYTAPDATKAIAEIRAATLGQVEITAEGNLPAAFKIENTLYEAIKAGKLPEKAEGVMVTTHQDTDASALFRTLDRWDIPYQVLGSRSAVLTKPTLEQVDLVAALPYVAGLTSVETPQNLYNHTETLMQTNGIDIVNYDRRGPIGTGAYFVNWETYGAESEYGINSYGRNIAGRTDNQYNSHGTNCGLIVSGANNVDEYRTPGMAPGAMILSGEVGAQGGIHHWAIRSQMQAGLTPLVSNHSVGWNSGIHTYDANAQRVDQDIYNTNAYMCVYPTGNYAYGNDYWGKYAQGIVPDVADYGNITGTIKTNKNGLAVHSTLFPGTDVTWANFGPTYDGRMKPEICAQGIGGTSYASPGVAGLMAVLYEQWKTSHPGEAMRADACKAVMLNTAMDVRTYLGGTEAGFGMDYRTGYGQIAPLFAVNSIKEGRVKYDASIATGQTNNFQINVPAGQTELRVMLLWNDPASSPGANTALINDLDLEVIAPDGTTYLPWTLDPTPTKVTLPAERKVNRLDNHERVVITAADKNTTLPAGQYTVRVKGFRVPQGPQNYVLTWQWRERGIVMTSIPEGYRLQPGQEVTVTWDMQLAEDEDRKASNFAKGTLTPTMEYRTSESEPWQECRPTYGFVYNPKGDSFGASGNQRGKNFFRWQVPTTLAATSGLQFRIKADDMEAISNKAHVAAGMARPTLLGLSPQQVKVSWTPLAGATTGKYIVYALYDKYMTAVDSIDAPATEKVVTAPTGVQWSDKHYFAIGYKDASGAVGQRSYPIGLDQFNEYATHSTDGWARTNSLCYGDTLRLSSGTLEGTVTWYKDGVALPNTERTLLLTRDDVGRFNYTISNAGSVIYRSEETTIQQPIVNLADTANWGDGVWNAYVFKRTASGYGVPMLTSTDGYYGRFTIPKLQFDSNSDLFPWTTGRIHNITGYEGCPTPNLADFTVVMKRTNFTPGRYTFNFLRASGNAELIVRDQKGATTGYFVTGVNAYSRSYTVTLTAESQVELRWGGNHINLSVTAQLTGAGAAPARVSKGLDYWINPSTLKHTNGQAVTRLPSAKPTFETLIATSDAPATFVEDGLNFNPVVRFNGTGGYTGVTNNPGTPVANATDFVVVNASSDASPYSRVLTFGTNASQSDANNDSIYASVALNGNRAYSTVRSHTWAANSNYGAGQPALITVRHAKGKVPMMLLNGSRTRVQGASMKNADLHLQRMAVGTDFEASTEYYLKGDVAEIVHYTDTLTEKDENQVRSYLAAKYGFKIDHDYIINNKVVYPVNAYNNQVVVIGQLATSQFSQRQSKGQLSTLVPSTTVLAVGDLAKTNAENTTKLTEGKFYAMGANMPQDAARYIGTSAVAQPTFRVITTKLRSQQRDELSLYIPKDKLQRVDMKPILLMDSVSTNVTSTNALNMAKDKIVFEAYDDTYMRVRFTPVTDSCFVRVAWDVAQGISSVLSEGESVEWDEAADLLRINVPTATTIELYDAAGRLALREAGTGVRQLSTAMLPQAIYVLKVQRSNGTLYSDKLSIVR